MIDYRELRNEVDGILSDLLKHYIEVGDIDAHIETNYPTFTFNVNVNSFCLEVDLISKDTIAIRTFCLVRDNEVFNKFRKTEVPNTLIKVTDDGTGQLMVDFLNSKYLTDVFIQSYTKKHYKAVVDYSQY